MAEGAPEKSTASTPPEIEWVPLGPLRIYHVTEQELDLIEKGVPESTCFSFAIFLLSSGSSFLTTLLTAGIQSQRLFIVFLVFTLFGIVGGLLLLVVWFRLQRSAISITKLIRSRKNAVGQPQP